jgi:hypothetical protein
MASPFRYFRKHSKAFFAVASVLAIGLFVFGSGMGGRGNATGGQSRRASATVATWDGGSINEGQLATLTYQRQVTNEFLQKLFVQGGGTSEYDLPNSVPMFLLPGNAPRSTVEMQAINTEVFSSLAEEAGITVSDAMINHYLEEFGLNRVDSTDIFGVLRSSGDGNAAQNEAIVFTTLRKLLQAYFYQRAYEDAAATILPQQRWADWKRVNERIAVQAAILPTEKLLTEVKQPTDEQLKALYEQYKDSEPGLIDVVGGREMPSPNPGFAIPRQIKLQYLVGSVAERTAYLAAAVTPAEIEDYYERNKRSEFVKTTLDTAVDFDNELPGDEAAEDATDADGDDEAAEGDSADDGAAEATPAAGDDAPTATEPSAAEPATDEPADESAEDAPAAEPTADETATESEPAAPAGELSAEPTAPADGTSGDGDQSATQSRSPFRLAALQAPVEGDDSPAPANDDAAETEPPTEPAADAAATEETAVDGAPADEAATTPATESSADAAPAADAAEMPADSPAEEPPVEYIPLADVQDEIRETLAREKAVQEIQRQLGDARLALQRVYNDYRRKAIAAREAEQDAPPLPEQLKSLQWLADQYGLKFVAPEPLTARQLVETPVGMAVDNQTGRTTVAQAAYLSLDQYEPFVARDSMDLGGDRYLVMKVDDQPQRVPPFAEVRDKVAAAWKQIEAAKLAEARAKELAEASEKATESFDEFFRSQGFDVVPQSALFSWRTYAANPGMGTPALLSDIPELPKADGHFMETAFKLGDTDVAAVMNHDRSAAYVIRLHSRQYPPAELKRLFLEEINTWPGFREMLGERYNLFRQSVDAELATDVANFKFDPEWEARRTAEMAEER